jgi:hypothetical protein
VLHRNRVVLLSYSGGVLRIHAGYVEAPDDVLQAIVRFLSPFVRRRERLAARQRFLAFPLDHGASAPRRPPRVPPGDLAWIERLRVAHRRLNHEHFEGRLGELPFRLSGRMRRRLGHVTVSRETNEAVEIALNRHHVQRDPWPEVLDTLLHEMVHQWQAESGRRVDHGAEFRRKLAEVNGRRSTVNPSLRGGPVGPDEATGSSGSGRRRPGCFVGGDASSSQ